MKCGFIRLLAGGLCFAVSLSLMGISIPAIDDPEARPVRFEYYIDKDPGFGNGERIDFVLDASGEASVEFDPDLSGLSVGSHTLYLRVQNQRGDWSLSAEHRFYLQTFAIQEPAEITAAEYFVGKDPGEGEGSPVPISSPGLAVRQAFVSGGFPLRLDDSALTYRVRDEYGNWSLPHRHTISVVPFGVRSVPNLVAAEYFVGDDPGPGNGIAIAIPSGIEADASLDVMIPPQGPGGQRVGIRFQDASGNWSHPASMRYAQVPELAVTQIQWVLLEGDEKVGEGVQSVDPPSVAFTDSIDLGLTGEPSLLNRAFTLQANLVLSDRIPTVIHAIDFGIEAIADPLRFLTQSRSLTITEGEALRLVAEVRGNEPFTFQWAKDGQPIAGATGASFVVANALLTDSGIYSVSVTDLYGTLNTEIASVVVDVPAPPAGPHPADRNEDFVMAIGELTAYGAAWKRGDSWLVEPNPIPIGYVTRAGALWQGGEAYEVDPNVTEPPLWWVNDTPGLRRRIAHRSGAAVGSVSGRQGRIVVTPRSSVLAQAVEVAIPEGVSVEGISHQGTLDRGGGRIKWGPFLDARERVLTYQLNGDASFRLAAPIGSVSFDGIDVPIRGLAGVVSIDDLLPNLSVDANLGGLRLSGLPGQVYEIEAASNPVGGDWEVLHTIELGEEPVSWVDPEFGQQSQRFYRARLR